MNSNPSVCVESHSSEDADTRRATQWLVSVRDVREARMVVPFGVDVLDFKEPARGPLAPVPQTVWHQSSRWAVENAISVPLSAALGEFDQAIEISASVPAGFSFAKVGPSGVGNEQVLADRWSQIQRRLPRSVRQVAVAYADHDRAGSICVERIIALAAKCGFHRVLIDTFEKSDGCAVDALGMSRMIEISSLAGRLGLWWALAGSVTLDRWSEIRSEFIRCGLGQSLPDCLGVRGDVCRQDRTGTICPSRMRAWEIAMTG